MRCRACPMLSAKTVAQNPAGKIRPPLSLAQAGWSRGQTFVLSGALLPVAASFPRARHPPSMAPVTSARLSPTTALEPSCQFHAVS